MILTLWPKVRATKLDQLPSQWIISGESRAPYCRNCGYSYYRRYGRVGVCFKCGQSGHMKRDCPLNVSWLTYGATAPTLVATLVLTTGSVVQHMGRKMSSRGAQSGMR